MAIESIFGYGDINRYEGRGDNHVNYYDRADWAGTVSLDRVNGVPVLTATPEMAEDILKQCPVEYNKPLPKSPGEYPTYGKSAGISLIDMKVDSEGNEIDIDDPLWDTFMDQLCLEDI